MASELSIPKLQRGYDTNLAAEFFVLSSLHRLGLTANLTLGNKKGVDIVVVRDAGDAVTVEVKGLAGMTSWPLNRIPDPKSNHFFVFVCYLGTIRDPTSCPEVYVVPSTDLARFIYKAPVGRSFVQLRSIRKTGAAYLHAWKLIEHAISIAGAGAPRKRRPASSLVGL